MAAELQKVYGKNESEFFQATNILPSHHYGTRHALAQSTASTSSVRTTQTHSTSKTASSRSGDEDLSEGDSCSSWTRPRRRGSVTDNINNNSDNDKGSDNVGIGKEEKRLKMTTRQQSSKRNYNEEDDEEEEDENIGTDRSDTFKVLIPRKRGTRSSKRKLVTSEPEEWDERGDSDDGEVSNEDENLCVRRSLRIKSSVQRCKKTAPVIKDDDDDYDEWEEEEAGFSEEMTNNSTMTTTRTGRVIKPTLRYS